MNVSPLPSDPGFPSPDSRAADATSPARPDDGPAASAHRIEDKWVDAPDDLAEQSRIYIDPRTNEAVVEVRDAKTQQVILESPPEKIRQLSESLQKLAQSRLDAHA